MTHPFMQATGKKYACKILPDKPSQGDRRSCIIREIAVMQHVGKHPYTLPFQDAFYDNGKYFLIMELCTGGELFDQIVQKVSLVRCTVGPCTRTSAGRLPKCNLHVSQLAR